MSRVVGLRWSQVVPSNLNLSVITWLHVAVHVTLDSTNNSGWIWLFLIGLVSSLLLVELNFIQNWLQFNLAMSCIIQDLKKTWFCIRANNNLCDEAFNLVENIELLHLIPGLVLIKPYLSISFTGRSTAVKEMRLVKLVTWRQWWES